MKAQFLFLGALMATMPSLALAQSSHGGHSTPMQRPQALDTPAIKGYKAANAKMHQDMDIPYTGDSDVDFVRSMVPHHQGAIDMAKVALQNTKDDQVRKWATEVIREQEREIAEMKAWLKGKGF